MSKSTNVLEEEIRACRICTDLPFGPQPIFQLRHSARVLVAGQAPGRAAREKGVPFLDASGDRLRAWMGIGPDVFYDANKIAIVPMGFCYPGTGSSGDLPPRPECAAHWRSRVLAALPDIRLTLVIGQYAQDWHLPHEKGLLLTEKVRNWRKYSAGLMPLPHPSPRNGIWLRANPWFEAEVLPELKRRVVDALV